MKGAPPKIPYPGLRPFDVEDAPIFFGREADVNRMLAVLENQRFLAVVGSSGSGKSSLLRAGLLPVVAQGFLFGHQDWLMPVLRPGYRPFERLAAELLRESRRRAEDLESGGSPLAVCPPDEASTEAEALRKQVESGLMVAALKRGTRGLVRAVQQLGLPPETRVLVVVDQFEEIFAFRRRGSGTGVVGRDEAAAFVSLLLDACSEETDGIRVVLTMRSDFIGDCEAFLGLPEAVSGSQFLVPRLDRIQMERAISSPGTLRGAGYAPFTFEEGLVNQICNDAGDQPDQLPLMQHALMRTWQHARRPHPTAEARDPLQLTIEDYRKVGGIAHALSDDADRAWAELGAAAPDAKAKETAAVPGSSPLETRRETAEEKAARHLFLLLCESSPDGQLTRRRTTVGEVMEVAGVSEAVMETVVGVFERAGRNFVVKSPSKGFSADTRLDISHEALLRQWGRLSAHGGWLERERAAASELRRLLEGARLRRLRKGSLLGNLELGRVREWRATHAPTESWARRYDVSGDHWKDVTRFIEASQRYRTGLKWGIAVASAGVAVSLLAVTLWSMAAGRRAERNERIAQTNALAAQEALTLARVNQQIAQTNALAAQRALTTYFLRTIGVNEDESLSIHERESVWELARLEPDNFAVRSNFLGSICADAEEMVRVATYGRQGFKAAVGLDPNLRPLLTEGATKVVTDVLPKLRATPSFPAGWVTTDSAHALSAVASFLPATHRNPLVEESQRLLVLVRARLPTLTSPAAVMEGGGDWPEAIVNLSRHMTPAEATEVSDGLFGLLTLLTDNQAALPRPTLLAVTAESLARIELRAGGSGEDRLAAAGALVLKSIQEINALGSSSFLPYFEAQHRFDSMRTEPDEGRLFEVKVQITLPLVRALIALEESRAIDRRSYLQPAGGIALQWVGHPAGSNFVFQLGDSLARLNALLPSAMALDLAVVDDALRRTMDDGASMLESEGVEWGLRLVAAIAAFPSARTQETVLKARDRALEAISSVTDLDMLGDLGGALADLGERLPPEQRSSLNPALDPLERSLRLGIRKVPGSPAIVAVPEDLSRENSPPKQAEMPARREMHMAPEQRAVEAANPENDAPDTRQYASLALAFARLVSLLPPRFEGVQDHRKTLPTVCRSLLQSIEREQDNSSLVRLGEALGEILFVGGVPEDASRGAHLLVISLVLLEPFDITLPPRGGEYDRIARLLDELTLPDLVEILKYPVCIDTGEELVLAAVERKTSLKFGGSLESFIELARAGKMGPIDLTSIPSRPSPVPIREALEKAHPEWRDSTNREPGRATFRPVQRRL